MDLGLKGKAALVTGASAGIGEGIARELASEGVRLALTARSESALVKIADAIAAGGAARPHLITADITRPDAAEAIAASAIAALGRVDILVNNAGGSRPLTGSGTDTEWDEAFSLNFSAARRLTARLVEPMKAARYGRIITLTGALTARAMNAAGPAKAALTSWSRALAFELGPFGITANCIAPGRINSVQIRERLHPTEESRAAYIRDYIPAGHFGEPEDIAALVAFLASPRARYISGAAIPVDGAMLRVGLAP